VVSGCMYVGNTVELLDPASGRFFGFCGCAWVTGDTFGVWFNGDDNDGGDPL